MKKKPEAVTNLKLNTGLNQTGLIQTPVRSARLNPTQIFTFVDTLHPMLSLYIDGKF